MKVESDFEYSIKLLIMGNSAVGKSNFIFRLINNQFSAMHFATIGFDVRSLIIDIEDKRVKVQIWDTAGQERYKSLSKNLFTRAQGIIIMYDITSRESFTSIENWLLFINDSCCDLPLILLGNKFDLEDQRQVSKEEGEKFAKENNINFLEVSAKDGINIKESIYSIAKDILNNKNKKEKGALLLHNNTSNISNSHCCSR